MSFSKQSKNFPQITKGFTLIELLIVIAILSIIATITLLVINPVQLAKQSRDSARMAEMNLINKAIFIYQSFGGVSMGNSNTIYISLPDSDSQCGSYYGQLTATTSPWIYHCSPEADYRKTNGTGWMPVNLDSVQSSVGSLFSALPIDPVNTAANGYYYTYITGSWALSATLESTKYLADKAAMDGGQSSTRFEVGNELSLNESLYPIPANGLVSHWKFDETTGTNADDAVGANDGTLTDGAAFTTEGKINGAVSFDGTNDYVRILNPTIPVGNHARTFALWFYPNGTPNWWTLFCIGTNVSHQKFFMRVLTATRIYFSAYANDMDITTTIPINQWNYFVLTFDGTTTNIYINNVKVGTKNMSTMNTVLTAYGLNLGADDISSSNWKGKIDEFAIWNRALTTDEMTAIYNRQN